jgi:hypothetical protein
LAACQPIAARFGETPELNLPYALKRAPLC